MDEIVKDSLRNKISALAYFLLVVIAVLYICACITNPIFNPVPLGCIEGLIGVCGIVLLVLHKRDLTGAVLIMFSMLFGYYTITGGVLHSDVNAILLVFFILFAIFLLATKEKKSKCYFCVFLPYGIGAIGPAFFSSLIITIIMHCVFGFIALVYAIMFVAPKAKAPLATTLRMEEQVTFSKISPVLGYFLFAVPFAIYAIHQIFELMSMHLTSLSFVHDLIMLCGIYLIILGILIAVFTRRRFATLLFILVGVSCMLVIFGSNVFFYVSGGITLILGICALLHKEFRILPAIMLILAGAFFILAATGISMPVLMIVLALATSLIAVILSFILLRQQNLAVVAQQTAQ